MDGSCWSTLSALCHSGDVDLHGVDVADGDMSCVMGVWLSGGARSPDGSRL